MTDDKLNMIMGALVICLTVITVVFVVHGDKSKHIIPATVSIMTTWDLSNLKSLHEHYQCNDVPSKVNDNPHNYDKWRQACAQIDHYLQIKLKEDKVIQYRKKFDSLVFPE